MTNIVEKFDIADKIIELLSFNHDQLYSIRQIHSILYDKHEEFRRQDLKKDLINKLKTTFLTIESEYNNIYRVVKNDSHFLIWSLKSKDEIMSNIQKESPKTFEVIENDKDDAELDNFMKFSNETDYCKFIKDMVREKNFSFMYESNYLDGSNHPVHILILNEEVGTLKTLDELTKVDYSIRNKEGKSCLDLAREKKNCVLLEMILIKNFEFKLGEVLKINETLKEGQKKNYDQINTLNSKITSLTEKIKELENKNLWEFLKSFVIFVLLGLYLKSFYNKSENKI